MKHYLLILTSVLWLGGCGPEVLTWDEEVLLNTGETIIVHREATYTLSGNGDNPFKMSMHPRPKDMVIYFDYRGKQYRYVGDADLLLLAIAPQGEPHFVFNPGAFNWDYKNNFNICAKPYYGKLIPDGSGIAWVFSDDIDSWLYGMEGNLSGYVSYDRAKKTRLISHGEIALGHKKSSPHAKVFHHVSPDYTNPNCRDEDG